MKNAKAKKPGDYGLQWNWHELSSMAPGLLYDMLALREAIFVVEQKCNYQELDGLDKFARHLIVRHDDSVIACLRLLPPFGEQLRVSIGRVAVAQEWRAQGLARRMMTEAIDTSRQDFANCAIVLSAQTYLQEFYESLGFCTCGVEFLEDGIPHIPMQL